MATELDLAAWEEQLRQERQGLRGCQEQVARDVGIPYEIKTRFKKLLSRLNESIEEVMQKTQWLRSAELQGSDFDSQALRLKQDYQTILHNITKVLKTFGISQEKAAPLPSVSLNFDVTNLTAGLEELKSMTEETKVRLSEHRHEKVEEEIREIRRENDQLTIKLQTLAEEQNQLVALAKQLATRLETLEKSRPTAQFVETPQRLLNKRIGEAERLLRR